MIADDETVEVFLIDGFTLQKLFKLDPLLGGRFYKYIAAVLDNKLVAREELLFSENNKKGEGERSGDATGGKGESNEV